MIIFSKVCPALKQGENFDNSQSQIDKQYIEHVETGYWAEVVITDEKVTIKPIHYPENAPSEEKIFVMREIIDIIGIYAQSIGRSFRIEGSKQLSRTR